jgi:hypothetical protein
MTTATLERAHCGGAATATAYIGMSGERFYPLSAEFRSCVSAALMGLPKAAGRMRTRIDGLTKGSRWLPTAHVPLRFRALTAHRIGERSHERKEVGR